MMISESQLLRSVTLEGGPVNAIVCQQNIVCFVCEQHGIVVITSERRERAKFFQYNGKISV